MRKINNEIFRFWLLDTCVISEIIKYPTQTGQKFLQFMVNTKAIPCIAIWSILELRKAISLYERFLELFSIVPFSLLKTPDDLLKSELMAYPNPDHVEPIIYSFTPLNQNPLGHLRRFMENLFSQADIQVAEQAWERKWRQQALDSIIALKPNFPPNGKFYTSRDAARFIQEGVPQYLISHSPVWAKKVFERDSDYRPKLTQLMGIF